MILQDSHRNLAIQFTNIVIELQQKLDRLLFPLINLNSKNLIVRDYRSIIVLHLHKILSLQHGFKIQLLI